MKRWFIFSDFLRFAKLYEDSVSINHWSTRNSSMKKEQQCDDALVIRRNHYY
ncbi:hypothetical protein CLV42_110172 [Chitinophaga ginsengisoli]|uniref:Uncharacterized protein n=1 Tax=Chitinophaga ginsengisoli TaxID=363837 RepID=A0A2P8FZ76_9BACT|nr:hypothetical protein CLV42_110172 [Chitinophaga ginsengisoli]